jgi:hypothetical protein
MATNITAITAGTPGVVRNLNAVQFQSLFDVIFYQVTLTDATCPAQVSGQVAITVPGVQLGDFVFVAYPADITGLMITAAVSAADTIKITTFNVEGTDAVTSMSGGLTANVVVLHPKRNN